MFEYERKLNDLDLVANDLIKYSNQYNDYKRQIKILLEKKKITKDQFNKLDSLQLLNINEAKKIVDEKVAKELNSFFLTDKEIKYIKQFFTIDEDLSIIGIKPELSASVEKMEEIINSVKHYDYIANLSLEEKRTYLINEYKKNGISFYYESIGKASEEELNELLEELFNKKYDIKYYKWYSRKSAAQKLADKNYCLNKFKDSKSNESVKALNKDVEKKYKGITLLWHTYQELYKEKRQYDQDYQRMVRELTNYSINLGTFKKSRDLATIFSKKKNNVTEISTYLKELAENNNLMNEIINSKDYTTFIKELENKNYSPSDIIVRVLNFININYEQISKRLYKDIQFVISSISYGTADVFIDISKYKKITEEMSSIILSVHENTELDLNDYDIDEQDLFDYITNILEDEKKKRKEEQSQALKLADQY